MFEYEVSKCFHKNEDYYGLLKGFLHFYGKNF